MSRDMEIAKIILQQLGGNRFIAMTGAKNILAIENGLSFKLPRFVGVKINHVKIILNDYDLYDLEFGRIHGMNYKVLSRIENVYAEMLQDIFTTETGLDTHL